MADFATVAEAEILFSESLEQLASYNGADMYKYNMLYTFKINQDVLTPESYKTYYLLIFTAVSSATSIICVKEFCLSSAVVASPVRRWSEIVRIASAFFPALAAFI